MLLRRWALYTAKVPFYWGNHKEGKNEGKNPGYSIPVAIGRNNFPPVRAESIGFNTLDTLIHVLHCIGEMALAPLVESHFLLNEGWWGEKGKLIFLLPTPAAIYIDLALRAMFPSLHASTGRSPVENTLYRDRWQRVSLPMLRWGAGLTYHSFERDNQKI
jgi:hypothetical protein